MSALTRQTRPLQWPPGLQHSYSNVPPGLTAAVIESVTGKRFNDYMREAVLEPLGMAQASFEPVRGLPGGFQPDGRSEIPYWHVTFPAFGGLNASLNEMAGFLEMQLNEGRLDGHPVFQSTVIKRMRSPGSQLSFYAGLSLGYGAGLYGWVADGHEFWGHGGDADGYRSRYGLLPAAGRGYLIGINTDNPRLLRKMRRLIEAAISADLPKPAVPPVAVLDNLSRYEGTYYPSATRFDVSRWRAGELRHASVTRTGEALTFRRGKQQVRLLPVAPGQFRRPADPVVTAVFLEDSEGALYLQGELGNFVNISRSVCPGFLPLCLK